MDDGCITNYLPAQCEVRICVLEFCTVAEGRGGEGRGGGVLGGRGEECWEGWVGSQNVFFFFLSPRPRSHQFSLRLVILSNQIK